MSDRSPQYFFDTHLRPNYEEWQKDRNDFRRAMNAAVSANQMADWSVVYWNDVGDSTKVNNCPNSHVGLLAYRQFLATNECPDFGVIRDIADCHKHLRLTRQDKLIASASQIAVESVPFGDLPWGEFPWEGGVSLVVEFDDGSKRGFVGPMKNVFEMWERLLFAWRS